MKKNKSFLSIVFVLVLVFSLSMPVYAAKASVEREVEAANQRIYQLIAQAKAQANECYTLYQSRVNSEKAFLAKNPKQTAVVNDRIKQHKNEYNNRLDDIGNNLISNAYNKVLDLYNRTSRFDVDFSCDLIPVQLGDKVYLVDPLRIVG